MHRLIFLAGHVLCRVQRDEELDSWSPSRCAVPAAKHEDFVEHVLPVNSSDLVLLNIVFHALLLLRLLAVSSKSGARGTGT